MLVYPFALHCRISKGASCTFLERIGMRLLTSHTDSDKILFSVFDVAVTNYYSFSNFLNLVIIEDRIFTQVVLRLKLDVGWAAFFFFPPILLPGGLRGESVLSNFPDSREHPHFFLSIFKFSNIAFCFYRSSVVIFHSGSLLLLSCGTVRVPVHPLIHLGIKI